MSEPLTRTEYLLVRLSDAAVEVVTGAAAAAKNWRTEPKAAAAHVISAMQQLAAIYEVMIMTPIQTKRPRPPSVWSGDPKAWREDMDRRQQRLATDVGRAIDDGDVVADEVKGFI